MEAVKIGEFYHFWDDGKTSPSRHYICKCEKIISLEEATKLMIETHFFNENPDDMTIHPISLTEAWRKNKEEYHWIFADETPYFVACSCPKYDDNLLYFAKTKSGGWFSMDINSWWQGGDLDIDEKKLNRIIREWEEILERDPNDTFAKDRIETHKEITY